MELDSLKDVWKEVGQQVVKQNNHEQLEEIINKSSSSPVAKMKRNLLWELVIVVVLFGAVAIYYFKAFNGKFSVIAWMYILLMALFAVYFYSKNKLLSDMQCAACMVKSNLEKQASTLERYVRFYLIAGTLMLPMVVIFLWFVLYVKLPGLFAGRQFFPSASVSLFKTDLFWLAALVVFTILMYYGNKWYIHRLYGRHIQKIKAILAEMNDE
ncbi:MAG: hypothetical protein ACM3H8_01160 [Sphingobacteriales bacterium]